MLIKIAFLFFFVGVFDVSIAKKNIGPVCKRLCLIKQCHLYPFAECVLDECNCCTGEYFWKNRNNPVDCNGFSCTYKEQNIRCPDSCANSKCNLYPEAVCINNICGQCSADYYLNGIKMDCINGGSANHEELENCSIYKLVECPTKMCQFSSCPAYPKAKCVNNNCGGCFADWYFNGKRVNCSTPECPEVVPCYVNPCEGATCNAHSKAKCKPNYCNDCKAEWFYNNEMVNC